jgi:hypothetical protein
MVRPPFLTRVVGLWSGCNLLGILEALALPGLFIAALEYVEPRSSRAAKSIILAGVFALMAIDLWWRNGVESPRTRWRFFSPFSGGCLMYVPFWMYCAVMGLIFLLGYLWQLMPK